MAEETKDGGEGAKVPEPTPIGAGLAFGSLAQMRNMEVQLRWIGFQFALGLNFVGWGAIGVWILQHPSKPELMLVLFACLGAIYANGVHYKILGRDGKFLSLWNWKLLELEQASGIEGGVQIFSSARYKNLKDRAPTIQQVLRFNVVFCSVAWVAFALWITLALFL